MREIVKPYMQLIKFLGAFADSTIDVAPFAATKIQKIQKCRR